MKKINSVVFAALLLLSLCACGSREAAVPTQSMQAEYQQIMDKLEAADYDGARALIDTMEGTTAATQSAEETSAPTQSVSQPVQSASQSQTGITVILTEENAEEYFEIHTQYIFASVPSFYQAVFLKEEYAQRMLSTQDVSLEVSYLLSNAHGTVDGEAQDFFAERYEVLDDQPRTAQIEILGAGAASLTQGEYNKKRGYFPDFAVDIEFTGASGTLILSE